MLLIDINSYFATLLQQENPQLRGKPVVIVKDLGRTCVIAASKEAKKLGIKTGSNVVQARQLAPQLIEMKAEFDLYLSATKKLAALFKQIAPKVDVYSLDEAFIDISDCQHLYPSPYQLGKKIQQQIQDTLGEWVTANVGIGPNRLLAKMAAEIAPKGHVFKINDENKDSILASVKFEDVCGIGFRLAAKLARLNIFHPYQIRFFSVEDLEPLFGPFWSRELLKIAYGEEPHHLQLLDAKADKKEAMKSVSRSITLWDLAQDKQMVKRVLYNLCREVVYKVRRMNMAGRQVSVGLYGSEHLGWYNQKTYQEYIYHTAQLFEIVWQELMLDWQQQFEPIKFRVSLGLLKSKHAITPSLLPDWQRREAFETAINEIDDRYGLFTVRAGLLLDKTKLIRPEVTGFLGDQDYQFNFR
jgi:DNA polymerase-4